MLYCAMPKCTVCNRTEPTKYGFWCAACRTGNPVEPKLELGTAVLCHVCEWTDKQTQSVYLFTTPEEDPETFGACAEHFDDVVSHAYFMLGTTEQPKGLRRWDRDGQLDPQYAT